MPRITCCPGLVVGTINIIRRNLINKTCRIIIMHIVFVVVVRVYTQSTRFCIVYNENVNLQKYVIFHYFYVFNNHFIIFDIQRVLPWRLFTILYILNKYVQSLWFCSKNLGHRGYLRINIINIYICYRLITYTHIYISFVLPFIINKIIYNLYSVPIYNISINTANTCSKIDMCYHWYIVCIINGATN